MQQTTNLGLNKPEPNDYADIAKINENMDKLDAAVLLAIAAAGAYSTEKSYAVGDYCTYGGKLRKCSTAIPSGETWTESHWTTTTVAAELIALQSALASLGTQGASLAPPYNAEDTYAQGDYCSHEGALYQANTDIDTPEAWDESHWTAVSVAGQFLPLAGGTMTGALNMGGKALTNLSEPQNANDAVRKTDLDAAGGVDVVTGAPESVQHDHVAVDADGILYSGTSANAPVMQYSIANITISDTEPTETLPDGHIWMVYS